MSEGGSNSQCCGAGAGRSRGFLAGAGADLKLELEPEPIFLGRLRLLFVGKLKQNDLNFKDVNFSLYTVL